MQLKVVIILVIILILIPVVGGLIYSEIYYLYFYAPRSAPQPLQNLTPIKTFNQADYLALVKNLQTITNNQNPKEALIALENLMEKDSRVVRVCHDLAHEIGHTAYEKYQDFGKAAAFQDDVCGSGYLHGVVEAKLGKSEDPLAEMKTLCDTYAPAISAGKCFHGIGHGLMHFTDNDVPLAIEWCQSFTNSIAQSACAEGVYMENFGTNTSIHAASYLRADDPLYPCAEQPSDSLKGICYYYSPIYYLNLHVDDYVGALKVCKGAEAGFEDSCIKGVGSRIIKQNIHRVSFAEKMCEQANDQFTTCLDGMVSYSLINENSIAKVNEMCRQLKTEHQADCLQSVHAQRYLANN